MTPDEIAPGPETRDGVTLDGDGSATTGTATLDPQRLEVAARASYELAQSVAREFADAAALDAVEAVIGRSWDELVESQRDHHRRVARIVVDAYQQPAPGPRTSSPEHDPIGTVRVHPDDDPTDPDARRYLLTDDLDDAVRAPFQPTPWDRITGNDRDDATSADISLTHTAVASWPRQPLTDLARVLGHHTQPDPREEQPMP